MRTKDNAERVKRLKTEVTDLGRNPDNYCYDLNTQNAYRIEHTKLGSYAYILINDRQYGKEARVDLSDFYTDRCYSYRWVRSSSDTKKDYPHTNIPDSTGKLVNLPLHDCMDAWLKHKGTNNFPHKTYARHLEEDLFIESLFSGLLDL